MVSTLVQSLDLIDGHLPDLVEYNLSFRSGPGINRLAIAYVVRFRAEWMIRRISRGWKIFHMSLRAVEVVLDESDSP